MNKKTRAVKEGKYNSGSGPMPTNIVKSRMAKKPSFAPKPRRMIGAG